MFILHAGRQTLDKQITVFSFGPHPEPLMGWYNFLEKLNKEYTETGYHLIKGYGNFEYHILLIEVNKLNNAISE